MPQQTYNLQNNVNTLLKKDNTVVITTTVIKKKHSSQYSTAIGALNNLFFVASTCIYNSIDFASTIASRSRVQFGHTLLARLSHLTK